MGFWRSSGASLLAALYLPGPGPCAPNPAASNRIPSCAARPTQRVRVARLVAVVAAPLSIIFPNKSYDQEAKSLLLHQLRGSPRDLALGRRSFFRNSVSRSRRSFRVVVELTTNGSGPNLNSSPLTESDGRTIPARGFEAHPLRRTAALLEERIRTLDAGGQGDDSNTYPAT